jgi:hypothetical protein
MFDHGTHSLKHDGTAFGLAIVIEKIVGEVIGGQTGPREPFLLSGLHSSLYKLVFNTQKEVADHIIIKSI